MAHSVQTDREPCATRALCAKHARVPDALLRAYGAPASPPVACRDGTYLLEAPAFAVSVRASLKVAHFLARAVELHAFPTGLHLEAFVASLGAPTMDGELAQHLNAESERVVSLTRRARELRQLAEDAAASALEARTLRRVFRGDVAALEEEVERLRAEAADHRREWDELDDFLEVSRGLLADPPTVVPLDVDMGDECNEGDVVRGDDDGETGAPTATGPPSPASSDDWAPWATGDSARVRQAPRLF